MLQLMEQALPHSPRETIVGILCCHVEPVTMVPNSLRCRSRSNSKFRCRKLRVCFLQQRLNHDVGHGASTVESNPRLHGTALVTLCSFLDRFYQQPSSGILHASTDGVSVTAVLGQRVQTVTIQCPQRRAPEDTDCTAFRLRIRR
jgi:hypothetical protein